MSDEIIQLNISINSKTFTEIYNCYWEKVFSICYNQVEDVDIAKELVQDIFKSVWERRDTLEINTSFERYLTRSAKLKVFEYFRNRQLRNEHIKRIVTERSWESNITEDTIMQRSLTEVLENLVSTLPKHSQRVFRMSRENGLTNKEIACELLISERTVEYHLANALKMLKRELKNSSYRYAFIHVIFLYFCVYILG